MRLFDILLSALSKFLGKLKLVVKGEKELEDHGRKNTKKWSLVVVCKHCASAVLVHETDLRVTSDAVQHTCPVCYYTNVLTEKLPNEVLARAMSINTNFFPSWETFLSRRSSTEENNDQVG